MSQKRKLEIFELLGKLNDKDGQFISNLEPDVAKEFIPLVTNRWMSCTDDPVQVYIDNEVVNPYIFSLANHKNLLWKLMCAANSGNKQRYNWIKSPPTSKQSNLAISAIQQYYCYSIREATQVIAILSKEEVILIASELGWQPDKISLLQKELKASSI